MQNTFLLPCNYSPLPTAANDQTPHEEVYKSVGDRSDNVLYIGFSWLTVYILNPDLE